MRHDKGKKTMSSSPKILEATARKMFEVFNKSIHANLDCTSWDTAFPYVKKAWVDVATFVDQRNDESTKDTA